MTRTLLTQKSLLFIFCIFTSALFYAQVGINTTSPGSGAMLDVTSTNKGILIPRVALTSTASSSPITPAPTTSLLVYNTATSGSGTTAVIPGFYFWSGSAWIPMLGNDWKQNGNFGTTPANNFVGTVDNTDLSFRTDNTEQFRITASGRLRANTDGTSTLPTFSWATDTDTGFFLSNSDEFSIATNGTNQFTVDNNGNLRVNSTGTSPDPTFAWSGDPDTGFYSPAADQFGMVTNGTERFRIPDTEQVHAMAQGTNALPFYSWSADPDTGIWQNNTDRLNLTAGGLEFLELSETANDELIVNNTNADMNTRIATSGENNTLFVDGANDNIGLGTGTPNNSAQLEMTDSDRGILINRVALSSRNNASPVTSPANGLLIYNTASANSGDNEVLPGFYYWNGSAWIAMGGTGGRDWSLEGNAGTDPNTYFIGTTDATDFIIRTDNTERARVLNNGAVGIGSLPYANVGLRVNVPTFPFGLVAETNGAGASVWGADSGSGIGVRGENTGTGIGLFGYAANSHGAYTYTTYTGGAFLIGGIQAWGGGANGANGVLAVSDQQATSASNMGLRAVSGSTTSISSTQIMNVGVNTNATDLALYALTEFPMQSSSSIEAARFQTNYTGSAINSDARDARAQLAGYTNSSQIGGGNMYYGGYFYSGGSSSNSSYAYAGARYNNTNYKIIGNGAVSTIVEDTNGDKKVMFASEAPEVLLEDYGTGRLANGTANISIDPILTNNILVDQSHPLKVFIQLEGDCNGVYVTNKSATGFTVKELQNGNSNVSFSYHIVANRKNETGRSVNENSNYSDLRFPDAPDALDADTLDSKPIKKYVPKNDAMLTASSGSQKK
ncbi:hypothetical protein J1N09_10375 [Aureitalea sp. L0-47]|uniref:hypothetical protein n=1 Tax=Aureitalea sp. L0-47 TaxID=2816962 RepID=UPI0022390111|nr:hypothetical protein [Aureitalea sp. L0-47]MCW5520245.1 hypothetical protein [Aureitalea sp. L0-47]